MTERFRAADADLRGDTVRFTTEAGINYTLTLKPAQLTDDDLLPEPVLTEAIAAAILNHPGFVTADASPHEDTITIQSRNQVRHLLVLDVDHGNAVASTSSVAAKRLPVTALAEPPGVAASCLAAYQGENRRPGRPSEALRPDQGLGVTPEPAAPRLVRPAPARGGGNGADD
ncbi:hypothetical protein [Streptomyces zhihengii]|uniref:hypothetical protein n=1 Tax=Streptomyces zhihengii TaxID=1818004 RepID=UPI0033A3132C